MDTDYLCDVSTRSYWFCEKNTLIDESRLYSWQEKTRSLVLTCILCYVLFIKISIMQNLHYEGWRNKSKFIFEALTTSQYGWRIAIDLHKLVVILSDFDVSKSSILAAQIDFMIGMGKAKVKT